MPMPDRLKALRRDIRVALHEPRGPYWNNVVMATLQVIDKEFGQPVAVRAMQDMHLDREGWDIPKQPKKGKK